MYTNRLNPFWATLLTLGAVGALATPARASDPIKVTTADNGQKSARVFYGDLDLATYDGQRSLDKRVLIAVGRVCQRMNESFLVEQACRRATIKQTRPLVLAAIERNGTQLAMVTSR